MSKNRITDSHKSSTGDTGYSDLAQGKRISKGTSLPKIYLQFDLLQHSLSNFIEFNPELAEPEDLVFFEYLLQMTFAVNGFLYAAGETEHCDNLLFDSKAMDWMEERIEIFKQKEKEIRQVDNLFSEFIVPRGHINKIRLKSRGVETEFWSYRDLLRDQKIAEIRDAIIKMDSHGWTKEKVYARLEKWFEVRERFIIQGSFLNRLSSYFYWMMRYHLVSSGCEFKEWMSCAPSWEEFVSDYSK